MKATVSTLATACFVLVAALAVARLFFVDYSIIPQNGMYPGLPAGSRVLGWKRPYGSVSEVKRGDVVSFMRTENQVPYKFIWRVVGLPGDRVEAKGDSILVNGQLLERIVVRDEGNMVILREVNDKSSYEVAYPKNSTGSDQPLISVTVPENQLFVLGDNRYDALDSRYFGPIRFDSVVARKF